MHLVEYTLANLWSFAKFVPSIIIKLCKLTTQKRIAYCIIWLYNKPFGIKQKAFTLKHGLNRGIHLSPSEINMQNSVIQALLTRIHLIKECM